MSTPLGKWSLIISEKYIHGSKNSVSVLTEEVLHKALCALDISAHFKASVNLYIPARALDMGTAVGPQCLSLHWGQFFWWGAADAPGSYLCQQPPSSLQLGQMSFTPACHLPPYQTSLPNFRFALPPLIWLVTAAIIWGNLNCLFLC